MLLKSACERELFEVLFRYWPAFWSQCLAFAWAKIGSKGMRVLLYSYMHWDERRHKQRNRSKCVPTRYNQGYIILGSFATEHHCGGHFHGRVAAMGK